LFSAGAGLFSLSVPLLFFLGLGYMEIQLTNEVFVLVAGFFLFPYIIKVFFDIFK
jgi:hypothetical protein